MSTSLKARSSATRRVLRFGTTTSSRAQGSASRRRRHQWAVRSSSSSGSAATLARTRRACGPFVATTPECPDTHRPCAHRASMAGGSPMATADSADGGTPRWLRHDHKACAGRAARSAARRLTSDAARDNHCASRVGSALRADRSMPHSPANSADASSKSASASAPRPLERESPASSIKS